MAGQNSGEGKAEKMIVPIKEGLFHLPPSPDDEPYLIGSKCSICGYVSFPKREVCPACIRDDTMKEIPLSRKARLNSFTVVWQAPPGFTAPYIQAFVELEEGPRIFTLITGCEPREDSLKTGQEMEMVIDKIREDEEGNDIIGWKFRPVRED